jgi:hypothetical protein
LARILAAIFQFLENIFHGGTLSRF